MEYRSAEAEAEVEVDTDACVGFRESGSLSSRFSYSPCHFVTHYPQI